MWTRSPGNHLRNSFTKIIWHYLSPLDPEESQHLNQRDKFQTNIHNKITFFFSSISDLDASLYCIEIPEKWS